MFTTTQDKKAIYKAQTVAGKPMDRHVGEEFVISDVVQFETEVTRKNRDGEQVTEMAVATTIFAQNGDMFTTVSPTSDNCLKSMYSIFGDEIKGLAVRITNGVSNGGNKFLQLDLV